MWAISPTLKHHELRLTVADPFLDKLADNIPISPLDHNINSTELPLSILHWTPPALTNSSPQLVWRRRSISRQVTNPRPAREIECTTRQVEVKHHKHAHQICYRSDVDGHPQYSWIQCGYGHNQRREYTSRLAESEGRILAGDEGRMEVVAMGLSS